MLEFEQNTGGSLIKEVSEATFMQDVVEAVSYTHLTLPTKLEV